MSNKRYTRFDLMGDGNDYQTYIKDCDCKSNGIILHNGIAVCRWCRKPYAEGGLMNYLPEHFHSHQSIKEEQGIEHYIEAWKNLYVWVGEKNITKRISSESFEFNFLGVECFGDVRILPNELLLAVFPKNRNDDVGKGAGMATYKSFKCENGGAVKIETQHGNYFGSKEVWDRLQAMPKFAPIQQPEERLRWSERKKKGWDGKGRGKEFGTPFQQLAYWGTHSGWKYCGNCPEPVIKLSHFENMVDQIEKETAEQKIPAQPKRDWEIVTSHYKHGLESEKCLVITSVKRLSDNATFSVGDEVFAKVTSTSRLAWTIKEFNINYDDRMRVGVSGGGFLWLNQLSKNPAQPQPTKDRDWEIVRWAYKGGYFTDAMSAHGFDTTIDSVKRISTGEIFRVGDVIEYCPADENFTKQFYTGEIKSMKVVNANYYRKDNIQEIEFEILDDNKELLVHKFIRNIRHPKVPAQPQPTKERTEVVDYEFDVEEKWLKLIFNKEVKFPPATMMSFKRAISSVLNGNNEVTFLSEYAGESFQYGFYSTKPISPDKFESVRKAIEFALDDEHGWEAKVFGELVYKKIGMKMGESFYVDEERMPLYTQKQVDEIEEAAWDAARDVEKFLTDVKYQTYQDYKKSKA